ncbi:GDP-mannose 4,6-dehydratase [Horticoccus sp. 23ND18S-11]|uniref:GDP-mannose 4,6-dehydratase n=1 Tax=Horticoccus sp. 23ND18S-11 TaxID=3391832 RepID=UPI0039C8EB69
MKVLITGSTGMIGGAFVPACRERGWDVVGLSRSTSAGRLRLNYDHRIVSSDIMDAEALVRIFQREAPDVVIHMAAQAFNGSSWDLESYTHQANVLGTRNVLNAVRHGCPQSKVLLACSSAEYGDVQPEDCPLIEARPLRPITPYGVSKVATECLGYQYFKNYGMAVYLPRLFIHVGTGHPPATAIQNFARQVALIAKGRSEPVMRVGRLDTARDFIDVRDGVAGMMRLLEQGRPGDPINICTGEAVTIRLVLETLLELGGVRADIIEESSLLRPSDEPLLLGDNRKLCALGWTRRYPIRETLAGVLNDWMKRVD